MVATKKYHVLDETTGKLDRRIFIDEQVYQDELEKIFGRAWQMIGHVSLVPNLNDYFHTYIGEDPVILTRDNDGQLHAFLNMCRHRGNRILRADDGNAKHFMCTYHGWTFRSDGTLEHVPGYNEAYYGELDLEELKLIEAKVDTYAGIVFATWDHDSPSLEDYLGDARWYMDTIFNRRDSGTVAVGPIKWMEPVNWKTPVDNCSDNYHTVVTHTSSAIAYERFQGRPRSDHKALFERKHQHLFVNGHGLTVREVEDDSPRDRAGMTNENRHIFFEHHRSTMPEVEERLGHFRAHKIQLANHSLFPNGVLGFRLALPRGPRMTEFWHFALYEPDAPEVVIHGTITGSANNNGAAGMFEQDDIDNWRSVTESALTPTARRYTHELSMGLGHSGEHPVYPGLVSERYISESNQRGFYRRWEEFMNAESWADISLEPGTAAYEGRATMHT